MGYEIMMHRCKDPNYYHKNYNQDEIIESLKFYSKFSLPMFILTGLTEVFRSPGFI